MTHITGAHRKVSCHCELATVARQVLVEDINAKLAKLFERAPDGRPWLIHILEDSPDLRERLRKALNA